MNYGRQTGSYRVSCSVMDVECEITTATMLYLRGHQTLWKQCQRRLKLTDTGNEPSGSLT
jgi:hypothetical protein